MKLVAIDRLAFQWRLNMNGGDTIPQIFAINAEEISLCDEVSHALLQQIGPGEFALCIARNDVRIHRPKSWSPVERSVGKTKQVALQWHSAAEQAAFARDLLLARQSELFSPAGV